MKKTLYTSAILSALATISPAAATVTDASLTTKGYVDAGLSYVHEEVGSKQAQLVNDANEPINVSNEVRTSVGQIGDDTHLVTEKAVRDAITSATSGISGQVQSITALETAVGQAAHEEGGQQVAATGIYAQLEGKQDALTTAQQNAVNSGVTSATVAQVATNTSDISTLQGQVSSLQTTTSGISDQTQSITALETAVGQAAHEEGGQQVAATGIYAALEGKQDALTAGAGVDITNGVVSINGLASAEADKIYVFKNNQAVELSTATTWTGFSN